MEKANLACLAYLEDVIYNDGELAFFDKMDGSRASAFPVQLEVFTIVLVTEGRGTLLFNGERYEAKRNDLLICPPHSVIGSGSKSGDFQGHCLCVSSSYIQRILPLAENFWDVKFLFETNVGAGLPIINTMNALMNSGDHILRLEAVLSGTLNYIFNTISEDIPFSTAIRMAKDAGYSEPDPRVDLCGKDVLRKLVILAREAGYRVEQSDVEVRHFIPEHFFAGSLDDFWENVCTLDAEFEKQRKQLAAENKRLRYVARMENGSCSIGLQAVDSRHPFYELEGCNNIIMISTERYHDYPMIIQGYGAGADVTAAGVFADIISIANIR